MKIGFYEPNDEFGFSQKIPDSYSFKKYCPPIGSQGEIGSCVGWSVCYAWMSIFYNKEQNITNEAMKFQLAMDPNYLYAMIKQYEYHEFDVESGVSFPDAMMHLTKYGSKRRWMLPIIDPTDTLSNSDKDQALIIAKPYNIKDVRPIDLDKSNAVEIIKHCLYQGTPVVVGVGINDSFANEYNGGTIRKNGLWQPSDDDFTGAHAMAVIGWDDNKFGGAFEIMNSWGKEFGDDGFVWIKYDDLKYLNANVWRFLPHKQPEKKVYNDELFLKNFRYVSRRGEGTNLYEGTVNVETDNMHGQGLSLRPGGRALSGWRENGVMDGWYLFISYYNREMSWHKYENGEFISEYGFSSFKNSSLQKYLKSIGFEISFPIKENPILKE